MQSRIEVILQHWRPRVLEVEQLVLLDSRDDRQLMLTGKVLNYRRRLRCTRCLERVGAMTAVLEDEAPVYVDNAQRVHTIAYEEYDGRCSPPRRCISGNLGGV